MNTQKSTRQPGLVSVIIPVYNAGKYLGECLDALIGQTYKNWEAICVDDGSMDDSAAVLLEYAEKDRRIRYISQPNQGQSVARNRALKDAKGEFCYFQDADDYLNNDAFEKLVELSSGRDLDLIIFGLNLIVEKGVITEEELAKKVTYYSVDEGLLNRPMSGCDLFVALHKAQSLHVSPPLRFFRMSALPKGMIFPEGIVHEDNYFAPVTLLVAKRAMVVSDKLYNRRIVAGSTMTSSCRARKHSDGCWTVCMLLKDMEKDWRSNTEVMSRLRMFRDEMYGQYLSYRVQEGNIRYPVENFAKMYGLIRTFKYLAGTFMHKLFTRT